MKVTGLRREKGHLVSEREKSVPGVRKGKESTKYEEEGKKGTWCEGERHEV